jgi:hypothetical protein
MSDSKYFTTTKKGEMAELKADLQSDKKERKKEAIKKIIANMTVGKDVSSLFADVVNCMQTDNLELKKLVYLYLMNYAKSQPDLAILAVNTFSKVSSLLSLSPLPFYFSTFLLSISLPSVFISSLFFPLSISALFPLFLFLTDLSTCVSHPYIRIVKIQTH